MTRDPQVHRPGPDDTTTGAAPPTALRGLKVLELGNMIAAPTAGCMLGDFGAEVVKVEHPELGDDLRHWPPFEDDKSLWWKVTNRNKRLITLNLSTEAGQRLLLDLVPHFDVVIENFRPGTLERWGIGYETMKERNPGVVLVRISGYGQTGPYSKRPGYGTVAEALSGIPSFTGFPETPPPLSAFPLVDTLAGLFAVQSALMAIYERDRNGTGEGQVIDVSLYESMFRLADAQVIGYARKGIVKERNGNRMAEDSPRNTYKTSDGGYVAISAGSQRTFNRLAAALGMDLLADTRFVDNKSRAEHADELDDIVAEWFADKTVDDAMTVLEEHDVVAGPVYNIADIFEDPHFKARQNIISVPDEDFGEVQMHGVVPKFSRTPGEVKRAAGSSGADNAEIYGEWLKLSPEECAELRAMAAI